jgi:glycerol kinase
MSVSSVPRSCLFVITRARVIREAVSNTRALAQILYHPHHRTLIKQQKHFFVEGDVLFPGAVVQWLFSGRRWGIGLRATA